MDWNKSVSIRTRNGLFTACVIVSGSIFGVMALKIGFTVPVVAIAIFVYIVILRTTHDYCCKGG